MGTAGLVATGGVVLVVLVVAGLIALRKNFGTRRNAVDVSWRRIDVELQRRHDLIGSLIGVAKGAARVELSTLVRIVQARAQAVAAHGAGPLAQAHAEQPLNTALGVLLRLVELKSSNDFRSLLLRLLECDNRIAAGRGRYNEAVRAYNARFENLPSRMVKGHLARAEYFEFDDSVVRAAAADLHPQHLPPAPQQFPPPQSYRPPMPQGFSPQPYPAPPGANPYPQQFQPGPPAGPTGNGHWHQP